MRTGSWFVLCRRERLVSFVDVAPRLAKLRDARVAVLEPDYMEIVVDDSLTGNTATIEVFVSDEDHVKIESEETAENFADRPDRDAIAAADARYMLTWDLQYGDETYNTMCIVAEVLAKASDGIVYDTTGGIILWSAVVNAR
ncbi:hypothetical protein WME79_05340 [Sorangium sp. So ce726]|uniref:hypothetical protein n=1 Tax=Sorangium sp. So ce726 TaxID=3133319 RepID=UPI003F63D5A1